MCVVDSRGLPLTTTAAAAGHYRDGVDAWLRVQEVFGPAMLAARREDPGFALAAAGLALDAAVRGDTGPARTWLRAAQADAPRASERERSHVAAVAARVEQPLHHAVDHLAGHVRRHPRDALALSATMSTLLYSGLPGLAARLVGLMDDVRSAYGADDWWWLGTEAFWRQEQGRYAESAALAGRALALDPRAGWAVHARTHVDYQTAGGSVDHALGLARLDGWLAVGATTAVLASHLSWHAALHELARGDCAAVLRRYRSGIAPTAADSRGGIVDAGSLQWRLALRGQVVAPDDALLALTAPVAARPPFAFAAVHAGLVFAAVGDAAAIAAVADRVRRDARPAYADVCAPVLDALLAFVEARYADCAAVLGALPPSELTRLGGSAVQRRVLVETRGVALLRAGCAVVARGPERALEL